MVKYFCGTDLKECTLLSGDGNDWKAVARATERAKSIIQNQFYVIGILEEFSTTLKLFEKLLPDYFSGALELSRTPGNFELTLMVPVA